jgi:hypothetical protein
VGRLISSTGGSAPATVITVPDVADVIEFEEYTVHESLEDQILREAAAGHGGVCKYIHTSIPIIS